MASQRKTVWFLLNLVQDVNIVRGLVYLVARESDAAIGFLISRSFLKRDRQLIWQSEVARLASEAAASMYLYESPAEAVETLQGGRGIIFAASESNLRAHWETGDVLRFAPPSYLRVTLQHGIECVGFVQSREHILHHGVNVAFNADVVCGWLDAAELTALSASERAKLYVTGPPTLLQRMASRPAESQASGLVCENLHSVRLSASGDHKASFMEIFFDFCARMKSRNEDVTLRPHPGGQYVLKNAVALPDNVRLNLEPIFEVNLRAYRFGISAPSTIVLDMVLAGIPVGLWRDPGGVLDASMFDGLTEISTVDDWLAFERDVRIRPEMILDRQARFLNRLSMPKDAKEIYRRFARLVVGGLEGIGAQTPSFSARCTGSSDPARRAILSGERLCVA